MLELFRRAAAVFRRFRRHRLTIVLGPVPIAGPTGEVAGYLDRVCFATTGIDVTGWTRAPVVVLSSGTARETVIPTLERPDVPDSPLGPGRGFMVHLSAGDDPLVTEVEIGGAVAATTLPPPGRVRRARAEARVAWQFLTLLAGQGPTLRAYLLGGSQDAGNTLRALTGLFGEDRLRALSADLFDEAPPVPAGGGAAIVVVLPVYGGTAMVSALLARLSNECSASPFRVVIVDDASPEPEMRPMLRAVRDGQPERFELIECTGNAGFVAACATRPSRPSRPSRTTPRSSRSPGRRTACRSPREPATGSTPSPGASAWSAPKSQFRWASASAWR